MHQTMQQDKLEEADFKYDNDIFNFQPRNMQVRHIWSQIYGFLFFNQTLPKDKFEGADFKCDNGFFEF